jgi:hypothetical protein
VVRLVSYGKFCSVKFPTLRLSRSFRSCNKEWVSILHHRARCSYFEFVRWKCYTLRQFIVCDYVQSVWTTSSIDRKGPQTAVLGGLNLCWVASFLRCSSTCGRVQVNVFNTVISEIADLPFMIATFMFRQLLLLTATVKYIEQLFVLCTGSL